MITSRYSPLLTVLLSLVLLSPAFAFCQGRSQHCGWSGSGSASGGGPPTPTWFDQTTDSAGVWLISVSGLDSIQIDITNMTADFDLYIRLASPPAPTHCSCGSEDPIYYRISDSGGLPGLADECEFLSLAELAPYTCILAVAYCKSPGGGTFDFQINCFVGGGGGSCNPLPTCSLSGSLGPVSGDIPLQLDTSSPTSSTVDVDFEFSTDGGSTYTVCAAAPGSPLSSPAMGVPTGLTGFTWDSLADGVGLLAPLTGVIVRARVNDGTATVACMTLPFTVDNVPPVPTCTLTGPISTVIGDAAFTLDSFSMTSPTVDVVFEHSTDAGSTFTLSSAAGASAIPNPAVGLSVGQASFTWDSRGDGVGISMIQMGVRVRATIMDGVSATPGVCMAAAFDVDNTQLCLGICGDCNESGTGPDVLDALTTAQIAAGLIVPTPQQGACCDVDASGTIGIIDALLTAQTAAGLPVSLVCR